MIISYQLYHFKLIKDIETHARYNKKTFENILNIKRYSLYLHYKLTNNHEKN